MASLCSSIYPENGNETLPQGEEQEIDDFETIIGHKIGSVVDSYAVLGTQPMMIAEFGTGEFQAENFDKAAWLTDAFNKIKTEYPRLKIFTWFNINKELDWRVNSSPESLEAFRKAMEDPYYIGNPYEE